MSENTSVKSIKDELRELDDQLVEAPDGDASTELLTKIENFLKAHPTPQNASDVIFDLTGDGGYYDEIRDYHGGEFAPQDIVEDELGDRACNEDSEDGKDDNRLADSVAKYPDTDWLDFDTLKPMTAFDAVDIIKYLIR